MSANAKESNAWCKQPVEKIRVGTKASRQQKTITPPVQKVQYFDMAAMDPDSEEDEFFPDAVSERSIMMKRQSLDVSTTDSDS
jgi:hypothetical protein